MLDATKNGFLRFSVRGWLGGSSIQYLASSIGWVVRRCVISWGIRAATALEEETQHGQPDRDL
jgi:hypothetical protein